MSPVLALSKRLMQSPDRQVAGVELTLPGNCWKSVVDPKRNNRPSRKLAFPTVGDTTAADLDGRDDVVGCGDHRLGRDV
jgi:hypothetical protein